MIYVLIILTWLFGSVGALASLLLAVTFTKSQRQRFPIIRKLDGTQLHLFILALLSLLLAGGAAVWKECLTTRASLELIQGPGGESTPKATITGLERELEEAAAERVSEAKDYFKVAERDFAARRYPDAAAIYRKSINVLPTMSGYLNLGISLFYVPDFRRFGFNDSTTVMPSAI